MNRLATQAFCRPCVPILRTNTAFKLPLTYRFSLNVNDTPLLTQISARRAGSTTTRSGHGGLAAKLERPLTILEKLQAKSDTASPDTKGFIAVGENEGLLFFDNIFPLKTFSWDFRNPILRLTSYSPVSQIESYIPPNLEGFKLLSVHPRPKEGGAFVKFSYDPSVTTPRELEYSIQSHLQGSQIRPWFAPLSPLRVYLVEGIPWTEDLYRFPSARLKVEFVSGPELSQESLYNLFRRFGKITEIARQPGEGKEVPRWAIVQFSSVRSACAARNCLHRARFIEPSGARIGAGQVGGGGVGEGKANTADGEAGKAVVPTVLRVQYERTARAHWVRDWIFNHLKVVIPALAAVIATITVAVFDPIRTWFIKAKITGFLSLSEYEPFKWVHRHTSGIFPFNRRPTSDVTSPLLSERSSTIDTLKSWLLDTSETFIVVQGPRGSGKRELVLDHVLPPRKNILIIDCEPITEAHGDTATIAAAAQQVGYRPVFGWMNTISSLADLAAQGTIGASAGFSQTLELQFSKILQNAGTALREIALQDRDASDKDANLSDEEYLSTHPEKRPVVVIDNFLHSPEGTMIYDRLASWAALLVSASVAHVVFLTNDVSFSKSLSKSLPDRVFRSVLLGDASPQSAKTFVINALAEDWTEKGARSSSPVDGSSTGDSPHKNASLLEEELDASIAILGGRLTDLEALATRIRSGEGPSLAVSQIVSASAAEINKLYLSLDHQHNDPKSPRKWSTEQAWYLITLLDAATAGNSHVPSNPSVNTPNDPGDVEPGSINYNSILLHPLFKSPSTGEESLQSLAHSDLITILTHPSGSGRPYAIRPGRPVYKAAFKKLLEDEALKAKMELGMLNALVKIEEGYMKKWEEELVVLATCGGSKDVAKRMDYLGKKIGASQDRVDGYEREMEGKKKVLKMKF